MYMWSDEDRKRFTPTEEVLNKCHPVYIGDPTTAMWRMKTWCRENDLSLIWSDIVDTADVSYKWDNVVVFYFIDPKDATAFTLKFK